jgi:hypothetical protein
MLFLTEAVDASIQKSFERIYSNFSGNKVKMYIYNSHTGYTSS